MGYFDQDRKFTTEQANRFFEKTAEYNEVHGLTETPPEITERALSWAASSHPRTEEVIAKTSPKLKEVLDRI